jgi:hypothetical protein
MQTRLYKVSELRNGDRACSCGVLICVSLSNFDPLSHHRVESQVQTHMPNSRNMFLLCRRHICFEQLGLDCLVFVSLLLRDRSLLLTIQFFLHTLHTLLPDHLTYDLGSASESSLCISSLQHWNYDASPTNIVNGGFAQIGQKRLKENCLTCRYSRNELISHIGITERDVLS